jgi:formate dehydrogenase subunit gamma
MSRQRERRSTTGAVNSPVRLLRFDRVQRAAHWANALLFTILILTALPLYFSSLERVVGRHVLLEQIHVWSGVALPVPLIVSLLGPWGARMREDVRRINRWTRSEVRWLRSLGGRDAPKVVDKFNPGQKLNAIFVAGSIVVMLGSGAILKWFGIFPVSWRTGATLVHEVLAFIIVVVVVGHIGFALTHRDSLRSMVKGWVTEEWAARHAPAWLREQRAAAKEMSATADPAALDSRTTDPAEPSGAARATGGP